MHSASDENRLKTCLSRIIDATGQCLQKLKNRKSVPPATTTQPQPLDDADDDILSTDDPSNMNINKFTLDKAENDLLDQLTEDIEGLLDDCFAHLSTTCANSFADHLHRYHYDRDQQKFSRSLTKNVLPSMRQDLKGLLGMLL